MKYLIGLLLALSAEAQTTYTTHYNLAKPGDGSTSWGAQIRDNFDLIDTQLFINAGDISGHIADTIGAHAGTAISTVPGASLCVAAVNVQLFLNCLDSNIGPVLSGGVVTLAGPQTIVGLKTFAAGLSVSAGPLTFPFTAGVLHTDSLGVVSSSAVTRAEIEAGTAGHVVINDGSGALSSEAQLSGTRGGTGISSSATFPSSGTVATVPSSGVVKSNGSVLSSSNVSLTTEVTGTLPVANGGTGVTSLGTANQIFGVNSGATANEYKTLATGAAGTDFAITHTAGTVTFNIPSATTGVRGLVSVNAQNFAGLKTFDAGLISSGRVAFTSVANSVATGANAAVTNPTRSFVRLTNASLTSIGTIGAASADGTLAVLVNSTGSAFTIVNEYAPGTAADRIITGTGADITVEIGASVFIAYDLTNSRWRVIGGSGGSIRKINNAWSSPLTVIAATGIALGTERKDVDWYIQGSSGRVDITANPQISAGQVDGQRICFIGKDDANTVLFENGNGLRLNDSRELGLGQILCVRWAEGASTWHEMSWSN